MLNVLQKKESGWTGEGYYIEVESKLCIFTRVVYRARATFAE
jgi:hypothetical protein